MSAPKFDVLSVLIDRPRVLIDKKHLFELHNRDALSVVDLIQLEQWANEMDALEQKPDASEADAKAHLAIARRYLARVVIDLPADTLAKIGSDEARAIIIHFQASGNLPDAGSKDDPGRPIAEVDWAEVVPTLTRFYPGVKPTYWLTRCPVVLLNAHLAMIDRLTAEESLRDFNVAKLGSGMVSQHEGNTTLDRWRRIASGAGVQVSSTKKPTMPEMTPEVRALMGLEVEEPKGVM